MNPFTSYTYSWWQIGIFKLAMLSIGTGIGAYWHDWILGNIASVAMVAIVTSLYITFVSFRQLG